MILNVNDDSFLEYPDPEQVAAVVNALAYDQFAILTRAEQQYVQTYHNDDGTYQLEYREGSADKHYAAVGPSISTESVAEAFVRFLTGVPQWSSLWQWEQVVFDDDPDEELYTENAYLLNGQEYPKVPVGDERSLVTGPDGRCTCCDAPQGEFHESGCPNEQCPCCHGLIVSCDCE